jgi:hypothetical protein
VRQNAVRCEEPLILFSRRPEQRKAGVKIPPHLLEQISHALEPTGSESTPSTQLIGLGTTRGTTVGSNVTEPASEAA